MARTFTITQEGESREYTIATGVGPTGTDGVDGVDAEVTLAAVRSAVPNMVEVASPAENDFIQRVGGSWVTRTIAQIKTALGLGTAAYTASTNYASALGTDDNYVTDAEKTKLSNLSGLNTGDQNLSGYAPLASPTFTGTVTAPIHQATTTAGMVVKDSEGVTLLTIGKDNGNGLTSGVAEGTGTASGVISHAEGGGTTASGGYSHAEGYGTTASANYSHAEGATTTASAAYSHAEGSGTTASGQASHAEGNYTTASGYGSHAEGYYTIASGILSHAEGNYATASGDYSHAGGRRAKATLQGSRVITDSQDADETSTLADQLTYRFQNGYQFKGGAAVFSGAVSGSNLSGTNNGDQDLSGLCVKSANLSDLASASTARTNLGLGTAATTASTAYATAPQGTDERVPTAAGLTSKFATNKATLVDADKIAILDSAASDAPKHGPLSAVWTYIKSVIDAGQTWAGVHAFSSTTRPTSSGTGTPAETSLITRADMDTRLAQLDVLFDYISADTGAQVTNSTTFVDSGLELVLPVGTHLIEIRALAYQITSQNGGWKYIVTPSGGTVSNTVLHELGTTQSSTRGNFANVLNTSIATASTATGWSAWVTGIVVVTTSSATIKLQHALNSTDAAVPARGLRAGSYFKATRLA